jgi:hypothetical protein
MVEWQLYSNPTVESRTFHRMYIFLRGIYQYLSVMYCCKVSVKFFWGSFYIFFKNSRIPREFASLHAFLASKALHSSAFIPLMMRTCPVSVTQCPVRVLCSRLKCVTPSPLPIHHRTTAIANLRTLLVPNPSSS